MGISRFIKEWLPTLLIIGVLYFTGWYKIVISKAQEAILMTGIIQPKEEVSNEVISLTDDFLIENTAGEILSGDDFEGKILFINLWATWCPPCRAEMPSINRVYEKVDKQKVLFLMISLDEDFDKSKEFHKENNFGFPILKKIKLPPALYSNSLPTTFIIDKNRKLLVKHSGMADYDNKRILALLEAEN